MENRLKELDDLLMIPENASDMTLVTEYTTTKRTASSEEMERWNVSTKSSNVANQL